MHLTSVRSTDRILTIVTGNTKRFIFECQPYAEEGMALLEKAAGQGHAYAMFALAQATCKRKEHEQAMKWHTKGAEAGLPKTMFMLGAMLDKGGGEEAPDYPAAAGWYRRAVDAGVGDAAHNLSTMYIVGRGRAWLQMPATFPHIRLSFLEFNSFL